MFDQMISSLTAEPVDFIERITLEQYQHWKDHYVWDAIQDQRYGQSFCNYFDITDYRIFYERDWVACDRIIRREYIQKEFTT